jgi:hypothetical protein
VKGRRINVIYADNRSGLSRDAIVVREALKLAGHTVWLEEGFLVRYAGTSPMGVEHPVGVPGSPCACGPSVLKSPTRSEHPTFFESASLANAE